MVRTRCGNYLNVGDRLLDDFPGFVKACLRIWRVEEDGWPCRHCGRDEDSCRKHTVNRKSYVETVCGNIGRFGCCSGQLWWYDQQHHYKSSCQKLHGGEIA
jgi:hypothetical protein